MQPCAGWPATMHHAPQASTERRRVTPPAFTAAGGDTRRPGRVTYTREGSDEQREARMWVNPVKQAWKEGRQTVGAWLSLPSSFTAELMAHQGFDWLTIDMQ